VTVDLPIVRVLPASVREYAESPAGGRAFEFPRFTCIVTIDRRAGEDWLHLSIAGKRDLPSWPDLVDTWDLLIQPGFVAVQVIPLKSERVNVHPRCLHLWARLEMRTVPDLRGPGGLI
jgi:hypothetical protein